MSEAAAWVLALGQQVWQQQQDGGASVCFVSIAPLLLAAAAVGIRSLRRARRPA